MFTEMENTQAYLKANLFGFAGSGKSTTATNIAGGLVMHMRKKELELGNKPIYFLDTESGSDWIKPLLEKCDIKLMVWKTRAFKDLLAALDMAEKEASILIIDSITHFWVEITETYKKEKNRKNGLQFQDWDYLKSEWRKFTDKYINSSLHIVMCGRAGFGYDYFENEDTHKKELEKTEIKMKAETDTPYEGSLLILMERHQELEGKNIKEQYRTATILKDRSGHIDGKIFVNPKFKEFLPHVEFLNLGGKQVGFDANRNSQELIEKPGKNTFYNDQQKKVALDEIDVILSKHFPSASANDKKAKGDLLEKYAQTRSWEKLETFPYDKIRSVRDWLWLELEKMTYNQSFEESGQTQRMVDIYNFLLDKMSECDNLEGLQSFRKEYTKIFENLKTISEEDYNKLSAMYQARIEDLEPSLPKEEPKQADINDFLSAG